MNVAFVSAAIIGWCIHLVLPKSAGLSEETTGMSMSAVVAQGAAIGNAEQTVRALTGRWADIDARSNRASERYQTAIRELNEAIRLWEEAAATFDLATGEAVSASRFWKLTQALIVIATAVDTAVLDSQRVEHATASNGFDCASGMSTATFRGLLAAAGQSLAGIDIHHIVPRSLGGADHPSNYLAIPSGLNRSLGNSWSPKACAELFGKGTCRDAITVSKRCGTF